MSDATIKRNTEIDWDTAYHCPHCDQVMTHNDLRDAYDDHPDLDGHYHKACRFFHDPGLKVRLAV
jgi:hypothetical protein